MNTLSGGGGGGGSLPVFISLTFQDRVQRRCNDFSPSGKTKFLFEPRVMIKWIHHLRGRCHKQILAYHGYALLK